MKLSERYFKLRNYVQVAYILIVRKVCVVPIQVVTGCDSKHIYHDCESFNKRMVLTAGLGHWPQSHTVTDSETHTEKPKAI